MDEAVVSGLGFRDSMAIAASVEEATQVAEPAPVRSPGIGRLALVLALALALWR